MQVNFHTKEDFEVHIKVMENQPDGDCVRLRLKDEGNMVDLYVRNVDDAYELYEAVDQILEYFESR